MGKNLVFVYGTLRRGGIRAMPELLPAASFIGSATVRGRLFDFGDYPGLITGGTESTVFGEVYEVDDETMHKLDQIELPSRYSRKQVEVSVGDHEKLCWVYEPDAGFYSLEKVIESGDWIGYAGSRGY